MQGQLQLRMEERHILQSRMRAVGALLAQPAVRPQLAARAQAMLRPQLVLRPQPAVRPQPVLRPQQVVWIQPVLSPQPAMRTQPVVRPQQMERCQPMVRLQQVERAQLGLHRLAPHGLLVGLNRFVMCWLQDPMFRMHANSNNNIPMPHMYDACSSAKDRYIPEAPSHASTLPSDQEAMVLRRCVIQVDITIPFVER